MVYLFWGARQLLNIPLIKEFYHYVVIVFFFSGIEDAKEQF